MSTPQPFSINAVVWSRLQPRQATLLDLTYTRALVRSAAPFVRGEHVRLSTQLGPFMVFFVEGEVEETAQRRGLPGYPGASLAAVRFTKLRPDSLAALQTFLDSVAGKNRREDPRLAVEVPVRFAQDARLYSEYTLNISRGGMFIQTQTPVGEGGHVTVCLELPGEGEVLIDAEVAYELPLTKAIHLGKAPGVGARFKRFHGDGAERLEAYVARLRMRIEAG